MTRTYSRRRALRLATAFGAAAVGGWLGLACGDGDSADATPAAVVPRPTTTEGPADGSLSLGVDTVPVVATQPLSRLEQQLVYSRLVAVDPRDATVHADLAGSFEVGEPLEVAFTLRKGVTFHPDADGATASVTADLVVRDFEQRAAEGVTLFQNAIDHIEAPDDHTVTIHLVAPFALLFDLLGAPDASVRGETRYAGFAEAVGTGPFIPAGQDASGHVLLANPDYHDPNYPRLSQVNVLHYDTPAAFDAAFLGSEIDVHLHPDADSVERALTRPGIQQLTRPARAMRGLGLSLLPSKGGRPTAYIEAFQDERVRRAVSMALDREELAAVDGGRIASPVGEGHAADSLRPTELPAFALYRHNPDEAARLLEASGVGPIGFRILSTDSAGPRGYQNLVERQLRQVGFGAELRTEDHATWETAFLAGDFEAALFEFDGMTTPGIGLRLHTTGGLDGRYSLWGYSNPVFDAAVSTALSRLTPHDRAEAMREAQRVLLQSSPAMFPLVTPTEVASVGPGLTGYEFDAFDFNPGWLASEWERVA